MPFYNVENYVGRCLDSLFTQTYKNIEYVFVDNCSTDASREIVAKSIVKYGMAEQCKVIVHEQNMGISVSRNDCLDNMTGDYFYLLIATTILTMIWWNYW